MFHVLSLIQLLCKFIIDMKVRKAGHWKIPDSNNKFYLEYFLITRLLKTDGGIANAIRLQMKCKLLGMNGFLITFHSLFIVALAIYFFIFDVL